MIRILLLALLLVSCGGGGGSDDPVSTPADPTTGNPPPPPPPPPAPEPVVVDVSDSPGAYFKSVVITVTGDWDGTYEASIGNITETDTGLEIRSDGRTGTGSLTIDGEEYFYEIADDDMCLNTLNGNSGTKTDCEGYLLGGRAASMIWYGEEDTQIIQIEIGFSVSNSSFRCDVEDCSNGTTITEESEMYAQIYQFIEEFNEFNARSKVYIEFVVSGIEWKDPWFGFNSYGPSLDLSERSDIAVGLGGSSGAGGEAYQHPSIYPSMKTPTAVSLTLGGTVMHEVGHAMSLGHGVWGDPDWTLEGGPALGPQGGAIFLRFGHGWSGKSGEGACGAQGSVMSYGSKALWTNSLLSCEALGYPAGAWGDAAGSRQQSDEAYALNRIRYSFSLIHNEHLAQ